MVRNSWWQSRIWARDMKRIKHLLAGFLVILLAIVSPAASLDTNASKTPGINAPITEQNIVKILNRYDKDGAYIIKKQLAAGDDILSWFSNGRIIDGISIAVHEETHAYSICSMNETRYFAGRKRTIPVRHTQVFQTKKMASSIPKELRTFRYNTYVAKPIPNLASNVQGIYGLLNEFMAYRMSMNNTVCLYPYYEEKNADWDEWRVYINFCENGRLAYAEFKYYILHYLSYAKQHYPQVYRGIVANKPFCRAYREIEKEYEKQNTRYSKDLKKMQSVFAKKGYWMNISDESIVAGKNGKMMGIGRFTKDYKKLVKEMKKMKYVKLHRKLAG